jgi:hypothetical protein
MWPLGLLFLNNFSNDWEFLDQKLGKYKDISSWDWGRISAPKNPTGYSPLNTI